MSEKPNYNHYSNKGGHLERSLINKVLSKAVKQGLEPCKSTITFCARRFAKRIPNDGKK